MNVNLECWNLFDDYLVLARSFFHSPQKDIFMMYEKIGKINSSFSKQCIFCLFLDVNFIQLIVPQNLEQILIFW